MGWREESTMIQPIDTGWRNQSTRVSPKPLDWRNQSTQVDKEDKASKFQIAETEHILKNARRQLKGSWIRDVHSVQQQATFGALSLVQRVTGFGDADKSKRIADAFAQASAELDKNHPLGWFPEAARGAAVSLAQTVPVALAATAAAPSIPAAGAYGMIAAATALETNAAITEGRDADLSGAQLAAYAGTQGVIEGAPAAILSKFGLHGLEGMFGKAATKVVSKGVASTMVRFGFQTAVETGENVFTEVGHSVASEIANVSEGALKSENIWNTVKLATAQSLISMGAVGSARAGLSKAESSQMAKTLKTQDRVLELAESGDTPSRAEWLKLGFPAKEGMAQQQRKAGIQNTAAFILETKEQQQQAAEAGKAMERVEEARITDEELTTATEEARVADEEAVQSVEALEDVQQPEAITEEPGADQVIAEAPPLEPDAIPPEEGKAPPEVVEAEAIGEDEATPPTPEEAETIALTKAEGAEIRRLIEAPDLPQGQREAHQAILDKVAENGGWRTAIKTAREVVANPRQTTAEEHVGFVLKARKLMNKLKNSMADRASAAESGDMTAYSTATRESGEITEQLEILTRASDLAGREIARALSVRQLRISLEDFSSDGIIKQMQALKKPGQIVSKKEKAAAVETSGELMAARDKLENIERTLRDEDAAKEAIEAEGVLKSIKKRGRIGQKIQEKARVDREQIKKALRDMGHQVHDITGVTIEGTYLIGRLGVSYIQEGAGSLVEVLENLRNDIPDLDLTQQDVNKALITKDPKTKLKARSAAKKRLSSMLSIARSFDEVDNMVNGIEKKVANRESINKEVKATQKFLAKLRNKFYAAEIDTDKKERAMDRISQLKSDLETGKLRYREDRKSESPELLALRQQARDITKELNLKETLAGLKNQLETGDIIIPEKRVKREIDPRLEDIQIEVNRARKKIRNLINDSAPWNAERAFDAGFQLMKSLKGTGEFSFTARQLAGQLLPHPWQVAKRVPASIKAAFSEKYAEKVQNAIENNPNFHLYARHGLVLLDLDSPHAQEQAEIFTGGLAEKIPGWGRVVRASGRQSVAISNLARTDAFDRYAEGNPYATREELDAFADIANKTTGIGDVRWVGPLLKTFTRTFYAPKFILSRIQTPLLIYKHRKLPRVRKLIAKEIVRAVGSSAAILLLAQYAGAHIEWWDVDDPDWMKIRIGNSRIDIFGSYLQVARGIARAGKSGVLRAQGLESDTDPLELGISFLTWKLSPAVTTTLELWKGKTAVGDEITIPETLIRAFFPMAAEDIEDAAKDEDSIGVIGATALTSVGVGVSTYYDSESAVRRKAKRRMRAARDATGEERDALVAEIIEMVGNHNRRDPENIILSINPD